MIIKTIGNKFLSILFCLTITVGVFFSCAPDQVDIPIDDLNTPADGYMQLTFDLRGFETPSSRPKTRAMTPERECAIDKNRLHVFVFNEDNTFEYKAPVLVDSYTEDAQNEKATVTIQLVKSAKINSVVVLANYDLPAVLDLKEEETTITGFYKQCAYSMPQDGKWKSDAHIPMWGKSDGIVVTEHNTPDVNISLRRAMARIDVGLNFTTTNDGKLSEDAEGVPNFKIKEVKVFRTYNEGLVGSVNADFSVANIPEGAVRRKTDTPLNFTVPDDSDGKGGKSLVREIYLPQSDRPMKDNKVDASKIHCVVVGGYYAGGSEITYYRMDFADKYLPGGQVPNYMDIAGNYRYVFNITRVSGPGFSTYGDALLSIPTIEYELIAWDESIHEMHVQGKHHFGLDNREITLGAIRTAEETGNRRVIKYQTNYPISDADGITFEWAHPTDPGHPSVSPYFEAQWTGKGNKGEITITALTTNEINNILTDLLRVKLGSFTIEVKVNQEYVNHKYTLDCSTVKVNGTYRPGVTLGTSHTITLSLTAEDVSINGTNYVIETVPLHGIVFKASGTFNITEANKTVNVTLRGSGTLDEDVPIEPFTVQINSNNSSGSHCEATIYPVIPTLNVLTIANNVYYNYDIGRVDTWGANTSFGSYSWPKGSLKGANALLTAPGNFGPNDNSIVKVEGFNFHRAGNNFDNLNAEALAWLRDGKSITSGGPKYLADILYVGHDGLYSISATGVGVIMDYMKKGGVVIVYNEGVRNSNSSGPAAIMKGLFPTASISMSSVGLGSVIPFAGNNLYKTGTDEEWNAFMYKLQDDPILYGPFGDLRDKQWGEDASWSAAVNTSAFPTTQTVNGQTEVSSDITIYSYRADLTESSPNASKTHATGFKYETPLDASNLVSFVFFGDGGFMSYANVRGEFSNRTICPLMYDSNYFPVPKEYGGGREVYNSQALCNTMAWAIERSANLFSKREAAMGR